MRTWLHIDSSPMGEASISRRLTHEFARNWLRTQPGGEVRYRDLTRTPIPVIDAAWSAANFTPKALRSSQQNDLLALSSVFTSELLEADDYVIGVPMHNWGPSASFKLWVDQIVRQEETLTATPAGPRGTLSGKRATFVIAAGASYGPDLASASRNFVEPWLRTLFAYLGVADMRFLVADGAVNVLNGTIGQADFLAPHIECVRALFAPEAYA
ncbi:NAD(P)H-dependent oxidoreductase [Paraburkholderia bryophila]|uniref:FMN-dependent NADH-azoreductase n=1 Tax=Paraburkholderia bryophila TaxID=420952 RepID=UPI00234AC1D3|nr:NAD(P)H-dependent oxidoreductase [Paraburkholderia bryophila]WCM22096.1 NAD(P)H-dependent oxidoreductase [Paraburkholderia bryophila]